MPEKTKTEKLLEKVDECLRFGTHLYGTDLEQAKEDLGRLAALDAVRKEIAAEAAATPLAE